MGKSSNIHFMSITVWRAGLAHTPQQSAHTFILYFSFAKIRAKIRFKAVQIESLPFTNMRVTLDSRVSGLWRKARPDHLGFPREFYIMSLYGRFAPLLPVFYSFFTDFALMSIARVGLKHVPTIVGLMNITNDDSAKRFMHSSARHIVATLSEKRKYV